VFVRKPHLRPVRRITLLRAQDPALSGIRLQIDKGLGRHQDDTRLARSPDTPLSHLETGNGSPRFKASSAAASASKKKETTHSLTPVWIQEPPDGRLLSRRFPRRFRWRKPPELYRTKTQKIWIL